MHGTKAKEIIYFLIKGVSIYTHKPLDSLVCTYCTCHLVCARFTV